MTDINLSTELPLDGGKKSMLVKTDLDINVLLDSVTNFLKWLGNKAIGILKWVLNFITKPVKIIWNEIKLRMDRDYENGGRELIQIKNEEKAKTLRLEAELERRKMRRDAGKDDLETDKKKSDIEKDHPETESKLNQSDSELRSIDSKTDKSSEKPKNASSKHVNRKKKGKNGKRKR